MRAKLTKTTIDATQADPHRDVLIWDTETLGFGLRVTKAGVKSFVCQYHLRGRDRRVTLGRYGSELTLHQGRKLAKDLRLAVRSGRDPVEERREEARAPKVRDLARRFMDEHAIKRTAGTRQTYGNLWENHIVPKWGSRRVDSIRWDDASKLHHDLRETPTLANMAIRLISKAWDLAQRWDWYPPDLRNPGRGHDPYSQKQRGKALTAAQLRAVGKALEADPSKVAADAFLTVLLTGLRPSEVRTARWEDLDLEKRLLHLPESKTGPRFGFLGGAAVEILKSQPRVSEYIFPGRKEGQPLRHFNSVWERVRRHANLPEGIRLYDATRHTFTTWALELGVPLERVKILVGHAVDDITIKHYTHFKREFILADADKISLKLKGETGST